MTVAVLIASDYFLFEKWFEHRCFFFSSLQKALVKNLIGKKKVLMIQAIQPNYIQ